MVYKVYNVMSDAMCLLKTKHQLSAPGLYNSIRWEDNSWRKTILRCNYSYQYYFMLGYILLTITTEKYSNKMHIHRKLTGNMFVVFLENALLHNNVYLCF